MGKQRTGVRNICFAKVMQNNSEGAKWGEITKFDAVESIKEIKTKANVSDYSFRAGGQITAQGSKVESKEIELTLSHMVDEIRGSITNDDYDTTTGMVGSASNGKAEPVAILFDYILEDGTYEPNVFYCTTFTIEEEEAKGDGDKVEEYPIKLKGISIPLSFAVDGKYYINKSIKSDSKVSGAAATIENWYKVVQLTGKEVPSPPSGS